MESIPKPVISILLSTSHCQYNCHPKKILLHPHQLYYHQIHHHFQGLIPGTCHLHCETPHCLHRWVRRRNMHDPPRYPATSENQQVHPHPPPLCQPSTSQPPEPPPTKNPNSSPAVHHSIVSITNSATWIFFQASTDFLRCQLFNGTPFPPVLGPLGHWLYICIASFSNFYIPEFY